MVQEMIDRFVSDSPITTMARAVFEYGCSKERIDELFREHAVEQFERDLLFSTALELLTLTVMKARKSVNEAYTRKKEEIGFTAKSIYDKLANAELPVSRALVRDTAAELAPVVRSLKAEFPPLLPGYRSKIIDGKHLGGTEHRLAETRVLNSSPLPGHWLVVLDPQLMLAIDAIPCEDAYTQERNLLPEVLPMVEANDLWIADRNFCTTMFLFGIARQDGFFLIRQHGSTLSGKRLIGKRKRVGRSKTGVVYEQNMEIDDPQSGDAVTVRRITIELKTPTRDGDNELHILTNVPAEDANAKVLAAGYRTRWTVESAFQELGQAFDAEIDTLCYPRAALLAYCVGLMLYNTISVVKASLRSVHGAKAAPEKISGYYMASELTSVYGGMMVAIRPDEWTAEFGSLAKGELVSFLRRCARQVRLSSTRKTHRSDKKPKPPRSGGLREKHVSTARLLQQRTAAN